MGFLNTRFIAVALIATALCLGCSTRLDRHWGEAHQALRANQTAHPNPAEVAEDGIDGVTAEKAVDTLRASETQTNNPMPSLVGQSSVSDTSK